MSPSENTLSSRKVLPFKEDSRRNEDVWEPGLQLGAGDKRSPSKHHSDKQFLRSLYATKQNTEYRPHASGSTLQSFHPKARHYYTVSDSLKATQYYHPSVKRRKSRWTTGSSYQIWPSLGKSQCSRLKSGLLITTNPHFLASAYARLMNLLRKLGWITLSQSLETHGPPLISHCILQLWGPLQLLCEQRSFCRHPRYGINQDQRDVLLESSFHKRSGRPSSSS